MKAERNFYGVNFNKVGNNPFVIRFRRKEDRNYKFPDLIEYPHIEKFYWDMEDEEFYFELNMSDATNGAAYYINPSKKECIRCIIPKNGLIRDGVRLSTFEKMNKPIVYFSKPYRLMLYYVVKSEFTWCLLNDIPLIGKTKEAYVEVFTMLKDENEKEADAAWNKLMENQKN